MSQLNAVDSQKLKELGLLNNAAKAKKEESQQDVFLKLMITQMKTQNPMDPQDNGEFLSQMAQFGTVEGISKLQKSFGALSDALQSNQALQASAMVGRKVLIESSTGQLGQAGGLDGQVILPSSASQMNLNVFNQQGELIRKMDLGDATAGKLKFEWDGMTDAGVRAAPGQYSVRAEGFANGFNRGFSTEIAANVDSVTLADATHELQLNIAGVGTVGMSKVKQIQ